MSEIRSDADGGNDENDQWTCGLQFFANTPHKQAHPLTPRTPVVSHLRPVTFLKLIVFHTCSFSSTAPATLYDHSNRTPALECADVAAIRRQCRRKLCRIENANVAATSTAQLAHTAHIEQGVWQRQRHQNPDAAAAIDAKATATAFAHQ